MHFSCWKNDVDKYLYKFEASDSLITFTTTFVFAFNFIYLYSCIGS